MTIVDAIQTLTAAMPLAHLAVFGGVWGGMALISWATWIAAR